MLSVKISGVVEVVDDGGVKACQLLERCQDLTQRVRLDQAVHVVKHVRSVRGVVVGVLPVTPLGDVCKAEQVLLFHLEGVVKAEVADAKHDHVKQRLLVADLCKLKQIEVPLAQALHEKFAHLRLVCKEFSRPCVFTPSSLAFPSRLWRVWRPTWWP